MLRRLWQPLGFQLLRGLWAASLEGMVLGLSGGYLLVITAESNADDLPEGTPASLQTTETMMRKAKPDWKGKLLFCVGLVE